MAALETLFKSSVRLLNINNKTRVAVACSGGGDSMALALLAQKYFADCIALTVDHGLRPASASEAKQAGGWLSSHGIRHVILKWKDTKPKNNIQEEARKARYRLMAEYCLQHGIDHLLVAHHLEDQAETFLLRLARGSGVDGLAAMAETSSMNGITLLRPLLSTPKAELVAYLKSRKQPFIEDESNHSEAYDRVRMRRLMPKLAKVGLTPERLAKTARLMGRARAHLETESSHYLQAVCSIFPEGYGLLDCLHVSPEIALRNLATLLMTIGGHDVRPRMDDLERLYDMLQRPDFKSATLGGCVFALHEHAILITRELKAVEKPIAIKAGETVLWDKRFQVSVQAKRSNYYVGALTQAGWLSLSKAHGLKNTLPVKSTLYTLPCLRDAKGDILAVPHLGIGSVSASAEFSALPAMNL